MIIGSKISTFTHSFIQKLTQKHWPVTLTHTWALFFRLMTFTGVFIVLFILFWLWLSSAATASAASSSPASILTESESAARTLLTFR